MQNDFLKIAGEDYEYVYDPTHEHRPNGGNWKQTTKGWVKGEKKKDSQEPGAKETEHQSIVFNDKGTGDANFALHKVQLTPDTVIYDGEYSKRYGDMSKEEQEAVQNDVKLIGTFSQKGFSNYNDVSLGTFRDNMTHQLEDIAVKGVEELKNTSTAKIDSSTAQHFKESLSENFKALRGKYSPAVRSKAANRALDNYEKKLCEVVDECVKDGSLGNVTEAQLDSFLQEDMKRLLYQELETRRRSMGDHGIRHLVGNAVNTVDILEQLRQGGITKGTTGKDKLMGMICQVNHDIGYTLGTVATDAGDGTFHKTHSGTIAAAERKRYADLLGEDGADMLVGKYDCYEGTNLPKHFAKSFNEKDFIDPKPVWEDVKGRISEVEGETFDDVDKKGNPIKSQVFKNEKGELCDKYKNKLVKNPKSGKLERIQEVKKGVPRWEGTLRKDLVYDEKGNPKTSDPRFMQSKTKHTQKGAIQYHDDADYDWQNNAFRSAVALADCTALFGKDKVQEFFLEDKVAMENVTKMHTIMNAPDETFVSKEEAKGKSQEEIKKMADSVREKLFDGFKKTMHKRIDSLACSLLDKDMLKSQVSEMTIGKFSTVEDILTRSSGELDGFKYDPQTNTMQVNTKYSQEGKLLEDMFGSALARKQWEKMTDGDLHINQSDVSKEGQKTSYGTEGKDRIVVNIAGMDDPKVQNPGVKAAYQKLAPRLMIQKLAILRKNHELGGKEANQKFKETMNELDASKNGKKSKGEQIFGAAEWKKLKELLEKGAYAQLAKFPMTETERAYLMGAFRTAKVARKVLASIGRLDRIARRVVMGWINTYSYSWENGAVIYRTDGELTVVFRENGKERQTSFLTQLKKDGKAGLDFVNKLISSKNQLLKSNPAKWMQLVSKKWVKQY